GARVLTQLAVLKKLDGQIVRVDLRFDIRSQGRERIERFGAGPLAFGFLKVAVADILGTREAEDITGSGGRRHVSHAAANDNAQLGFEVSAVFRKRDFDFAAIGDEGGGGLEPK